MNKNFVEELRWRGMVHDIMPGAEEQLKKEMTSAYVGIDPTADSLHIGHLVSVMILKHFQLCGHRPIALVGGATGMIGDPSGKSDERNLLDEATLRHNQEAIKAQLGRLLDFNSDAANAAKLVNNYDWMSKMSFLTFIRDVGKLITVNYMMSKDSVKKRFSGEGDGMSFTEFTYQLVQGYDFLHLFQAENCKIQLGGSDQWGNITTGTELIRRSIGGEAWGLTCPLIKKADGTKFGKTESGNIWLEARYTSPYKFYQFWLNVSDDDAKSYIKIFTLLDKQTIDALIEEHATAPHLRVLQKALAKEITCMIHSEAEWSKAVEASSILFSKSTKEDFERLDEQTIEQIYDGEANVEIARNEFLGVNFVDAATACGIFDSKREARELIGAGAVFVSCGAATIDMVLSEQDVIKGRFVTIKKGKKKNILVKLK